MTVTISCRKCGHTLAETNGSLNFTLDVPICKCGGIETKLIVKTEVEIKIVEAEKEEQK